MPPQTKQQAQANNNNNNNTNNNNSSKPADPYLGKELRIELTDGRVVVGTLLAYEGGGDLLLQGVVEQRFFQNTNAYVDKNNHEKEITLRRVNLLSVPFKFVKQLHQRKAGHPPIALEGEEEAAAEHK